MTDMTEKLTMELKALAELKRSNVLELYGMPIDDLVDYARLRRDGVQKLQQAQKGFIEVIGQHTKIDNELMKKARNVMTKVNEARTALKLASKGYSKSEQLKPAQVIVDAQLSEVETLHRAIELWWQGLIYEQLHGSRLRLAHPITENDVSEAKRYLEKAQKLLYSWPSSLGDGQSSSHSSRIHDATEKAVNKVEEKIENSTQELIHVRIAEVENCLNIVDSYLSPSEDKAQTTEIDGEFASIYAALACLSQAKLFIEALKTDSTANQQHSFAADLNALEERYKELLGKAQQALRKGTEQKQAQIGQLATKVEESLPSSSSEMEFLKKMENCKLIDELRYQLYLFPGASIDFPVQKVITQRIDNIQESYRILKRVQQDGPQRGAYWAYNELQKAKELNPGAEDISQELESWKDKRAKKEQDFNRFVSAIESLCTNKSEQHYSTLANQDNAIIVEKLSDLEDLYHSEGSPKEWQKKFDSAKKKIDWMCWVYGVSSNLKKLVDTWKADRPVNESLLDETEKLIEQLNEVRWWPKSGKTALNDAIMKKWTDAPGNELISDPLLVEKIQLLLTQLSNKNGGAI